MRRLLALVALLLASVSIAQLSITREGYWLCENGDGVSRHAEEKDALEACSNAALASPGEVRRVTPPAYRVVADANAQVYLRAPKYTPPVPGVGWNPSDYEVDEDEGSITLTAVRDAGATGSCSLDYTTVDSSAKAGTDYTAASGTLEWGEGETGPKTVEVSITDTPEVSQDLLFTVVLTEDECEDDIELTIASVTIHDVSAELLGCGFDGELVTDLPEFEGTTYQITPAMTMAQVNAINAQPGDAILFQAGGTWNVTSSGARLQTRSGVWYGRYGDGANPQLVGSGGWSCSWCGMIEVASKSNVTIDGIDSIDSYAFGVMVYPDAENITIRNLKVDTRGWGGVYVEESEDITIDNVEVTGVPGGPHESFAIVNVDGFVVKNSWAHDNGHAAINVKSNSRNGEVYDSIFERTNNDPTVYCERCENVLFYRNIMRDNLSSSTMKPLFAFAIEPFDSCSTRYVRNVEIFDNWIYNGGRLGVDVWIKETAYQGTFDYVTQTLLPPACSLGNQAGVPEQLIHNIHIHDNTIVSTGTLDETWTAAIRTFDSRSNRDASDWSGILIENNIIWDTGAANAFIFGSGTGSPTVRYNLFQTGETGTLGSNAVTTSNVMFEDAGDGDYNIAMGSPAAGAGLNGTDIGAYLPNCP